ncbi:hypothetical protein NMY22_g5814 [Coprinellus aureogranulatus]|nr:hypothetical protein NMY22_g5814 [Coprinellus aureogranulatus]
MEVRVHNDDASHEGIPHPGNDWTRFVCISDTHSRFPDVPAGDVLLHAGDLSSWGYPAQVQQVFDWLMDLPHPVKIVIAGNHDLCLDTNLHGVFENEVFEVIRAMRNSDHLQAELRIIRQFVRSEQVKERGVYYLEHEGLEFSTRGERWKVYGSPAAPRYASGAFQYEDESTAQAIYDNIPSDTEILLTHTPPFGVLDLSKKGKKAGCRCLGERLANLHRCRLHVFGHMHEAFGAEILSTPDGQRVAVNAAVASRKSKPIHSHFVHSEMLVELNKSAYAARVKRVYEAWNNASKNDDYASISDADALLLVAGDPAAEDEPMRKGTCFQQWLLGYEFPSTLILFQKDKIAVLCSASKAKILAQIQNVPGIPSMEIYAQAKAKEPANDAIPNFLALYKTAHRVGTLLKETHTGKLVSEWQRVVAELDPKPELVEMAPAVSTLMAVKDAEELKLVQTAATLTSTLLKYHVAPKLESILDRESKVTHEALSVQIEARLGSGEGDNAKGPDMKVWGKGKDLTNIDWQSAEFCYPPIIISKSSKTGYDLRYTIESTEDNIAHKGVLLVSFGLRYKSYSTNVGGRHC